MVSNNLSADFKKDDKSVLKNKKYFKMEAMAKNITLIK